MLDDFLIRALLGGIAIALVAAPLGCFLVWRRLAYFGDTLSHSALLGIALGLLLHWNLQFSVLLVCITMAVLLVHWQQKRALANDTLLGIMAQSSLALGVILVTFVPGIRVDLIGLLFGDILAISRMDLVWIGIGAICVWLLLARFWDRLLAMTIHEELAAVDGVNVPAMRLLLTVMLAIVIAMTMKIVGVLLITSLLIIPAASARLLAKSPEQMCALACVLGVLAVLSGLGSSVLWDIPTGPAMVVCAGLLMALMQLISHGLAYRQSRQSRQSLQ